MKKRLILLVLTCVLCGIGVQAQRPVGDTTYVGGDADYYYDTIYLNNNLIWEFHRPNHWYSIDFVYYIYMSHQPIPQGGYSGNPNRALYDAGPHIKGQEFATPEKIMVKGLAFCPEMLTDLEMLSYCQHYPIALSDPSYLPPYYFDVVDTTMTGRETEYVQLYTLVGGTPQLQAEKGWHIEDTHRYMRCTVYNQQTQLNETGYTPLYEVMFDTGILIEDTSFIVAGTHNNNGLTWGHVDGYTNPRILLEHYPTRYAEILITNFRARYYNTSYWLKIDGSWYCTREEIGPMGVLLSIFPILDTMFGSPCATVSNLQAVEVDTLWATVMWSADARHHDWEVEYWPSSSSDSATVVTDSVPMVTLTGLMPGTEYSVRVRGLCDIDNYSPWSDTLLFTTPQDTTPDTLPWVIPSTLDARDMGSLDRFTRMMPNPAGEVVNVLSSYRLESVAVYDLSGRLLLEQPAEGISATLDVSALPRGTYIVAIRTLQGVATKKLVVE